MHKHYTPNRTTQQIQQDLAIIQTLRKDRPRNHYRSRNVDWVDVGCRALSAILYTGSAACLIYIGVTIFKK
jgi:hypothetical protein